jgi:DNA-binding beta-propeller fold protein YncE
VAAAVAALLASMGASAAASMAPVYPVAGGATAGALGDGGLAGMAMIGAYDVASLPDCGFLIADGYHARVRRVWPNGVITTVAGNGRAGFGGDGGPAAAARLQYPRGVAGLPAGGFLIADEYNRRVRRVSASGTITTVAGTGVAGFSGDGGPATRARLGLPVSVAPTADGGFLVADALNGRIRRVGPDGVITTVAGTGVPGFAGDGGPATAAQIGFPVAVAALPGGGFLLADQYGENVRRVDAYGGISTVAGVGRPGMSGDGGQGRYARLDYPRGMAVAGDGSILIADQGNRRVRHVGTNGVITTLAMTGRFGGPRGVAVTPDGGALIATAHGVAFIDARLPRPAGARPCQRLLLMITAYPRRVRPHAMAAVRFVASRPGPAEVMVRRLIGRRYAMRSVVVRRVALHARRGRNRAVVPAPARPGRYRLEVRVRAVGGMHAGAMGMIRVVAR